MRTLSVLSLMMLLAAGAANSQTLDARVAAGVTLKDRGNSFAAGVGFSPAPAVTFAVNFERTHLESRFVRTPTSSSSFRGGTLSLGTIELQIAPWRRPHLHPFAVIGYAAGQSRPNVNDVFPTPVTNDVRAIFVGGGVKVPVNERLSVFGDLRMMGGAEGVEGVVAVIPLRAGISWRF